MAIFQHRRGFTLMEVNLAIFIMAVAVLGMVALYPLGFRESQHSRDDIVEAAVADGILNPLAAALSTCGSNMTWQAWKQIVGSSGGALQPANGWSDYCNGDAFTPRTKSQVNVQTRAVIQRIADAYKGDGNPASDALAVLNNCGLACALVLSQGELPTFGNAGGNNGFYLYDHSRIVLTLRLSRRAAQLFEQPAFYTEVHYQGDPNYGGGTGP
ncbi:MAG: prepilin-type N-terminal cleavage/methylation domain-containing protein [Kiritimatiellae bacterium]|nr:prepilin-type N-terminal cleavage/methylation domain-containing protein [Kiritimatiellia bacterium]